MMILSRVFLSLLLLSLVACGTVSERKMVGSEAKKTNDEGTVPIAEYNALLAKYQALLSKEGGEEAKTHEDLSQSNEVAETVDLSEGKNIEQAPVNEKDLQYETNQLASAYQLQKQNKNDDALKIFQSLEKSPHAQVQVRAKYALGEMLFVQKEYDLAMQMFEEILHNHAYSGHTILALKKLVVCTEELQLEEKHKKYQSLVNGILDQRP